MTAREFLAFAGLEDTEENRAALDDYLGPLYDSNGIRTELREFPDWEIPVGLETAADEPAAFQEYMEGL